MSIFYCIEENDGVEGCFRFIDGLCNWQDNYAFIEELSEDGLFFLNYIQDEEICETEAYRIFETMYKGIICNSKELVNREYSSFTRKKEVALTFAEKSVDENLEKQNLERIIIEKTGKGFCLNKIIEDSIIWIHDNKKLVSKEYEMEELIGEAFTKEIDTWFYGENEIISSMNSKEYNFLSIEAVI